MSKPMPIEVFAKKIGIDKKEQQWIMDNDKEDHYYNNSALKKDWLSLSYPVYDGDYYFAFINDSKRVSAQQNAKMNRELRRLAGSNFDAEKIYRELYKYGQMHAKNSGLGDTMTREEMWKACVDIRKKNPVKEEVEESKKMTSAQKREFDKLYKKMDGGKEHQAIKQKIKNPVKADDAFHSLVMKKVMGESNILDTYRQMWEDGEKYAPKLELGEQDLHEEVANITVDPKNRINSGQQQAYHGMEIAKQARRFGLKSAVMHKHVRVKGPKKKVNDFLRIIIGKSTYGDPTEKDMSTPQVDKMLTKGLK